MTCRCYSLSPFLWASHPRPSIFSKDSAFTYGASTGTTQSQKVTQAVARFEAKHGYSIGSIAGISPKADASLGQRQAQRRIARAKKAA